jgi:hypothetical protein
VVGHRIGERALDVAEQLGLQQRLGDGAAVDRDEGRAGARAGRWMARAIISLPVPLSPRSSTLASDLATSQASASSSAMRLDRLMISLRQASSPCAAASAGAPRASAWAILSSSSRPS